MKKIFLIVLGLFLIFPQLADAQSQRNPCWYKSGSTTSCIPTGADNPLPISGSITANLGGFHQESVLTPITATTGGATSSAFTLGKTIVVSNAGTTNTAYCQLGNSSSTSGQQILPGQSVGFTSTTETTITCNTSTSTTTINFSVGTGLPTGWGGGGSSGAVFGPTAVGTAAANPPVLMGGNADGTATGAISAWKIVSGVGFVNAVQGGTWTIQPGNTPNTTAWLMNVGAMGGNAITCTTTAYGTAPTGNCIGANVFVTNAVALGAATPALSSPVANANQYSNYETIAASQTAQAMGATGATGDYLSHCVIYPTSTSPGLVTVFDNTNAATTNVILFAGGTSSTSNLTPITVPVGAFSVSGAWKVTTGANVSAVCYGKFT